MNFLFSTSISRPIFLWRFILVHIVFLLATGLIIRQESVEDLISSFMCVVILAAFVYHIRFVIIARLDSIGASYWYSLLMGLPFAALLVWVLSGTEDASTLWGILIIVLGIIYLLYLLLLFILPKDAFLQSSILQAILYDYEVGEGRIIIFLIPLTAVVLGLAAYYNFKIFCGLDDAQSMDNAQLARQIARGEGFTTRFVRPQAVTQLRNYAAKRSLTTGESADLFPAAQFPPRAPRILPDTYNAPGYPCLLATWFYIVRPHFEEMPPGGKANSVYSGDRWIPFLNLIFVILTGILIFFMGRRLFDDRVAWLSVVSFFFTDLVWQFSLTGLSTCFLMFLVTAAIFCALEISRISENCFEDDEESFAPAWGWGLLLSLFLVAACLTRLPLLVLLVPLFVVLVVMPRPSWLLFATIALIAIASVLPWLWHLYQVSGNPLGSSMALLLYGTEGFKGNQVFCAASLPTYESLFKNLSQKETSGFLWHLEHAWQLLGTNPLILLFGASLMHAYKRRRAQMLQWFLAGTALVLIGINNFGAANPEPMDAWNIVVLLFPAMLVMGSAFFFIQLDRLNLQIWLLNNIIIIFFLALTALPGALAMTSASGMPYAFPPYVPPTIKAVSELSRPDEWVTTDLPWASAWYGDRVALWLPDTIADFVRLHDNVCPTGLLLVTPEIWSKPASNLLTGEDHEWLFLATGAEPPPNLPLSAHTVIRGLDYVLWSDHPRWSAH